MSARLLARTAGRPPRWRASHLLGTEGDGVRGPAAVGALGAAITAYLAVRFLMRFFKTNRLTPFAMYCVAAGALLSIGFLLT